MIATRGRYRIVHHASFGEQGRFSIGTSGVLSTTAKAPQRAGKGPTGATPSTAHSARKSKAQEATMARSGSGMSSLGANSSSQANHMSSPETSSAGATIPLVLQAVGPGDPDGSPLVVIDGSNVAFAYREDISRPEWSPQGILLALEVHVNLRKSPRNLSSRTPCVACKLDVDPLTRGPATGTCLINKTAGD